MPERYPSGNLTSIPLRSTNSPPRYRYGYGMTQGAIERIERIRAVNLAILLNRRGDKARAAEKLDVDPSYVSNLASGRKRFFDETAREIEQALDWPAGILDVSTLPMCQGDPARPQLPQEQIDALQKVYDRREPPEKYHLVTASPAIAWEGSEDLNPNEHYQVPRYDIRVSAGNGQTAYIETKKTRGQAYRLDFLRSRGIRPEACVVVTCEGDSMEGTISDGATMLVNTDETDVADGKVYVIRYDDQLRTKRLYRRPGGGLTVASDNPAYETLHLSPEEAEHVVVIGRVRQSQSEH